MKLQAVLFGLWMTVQVGMAATPDSLISKVPQGVYFPTLIRTNDDLYLGSERCQLDRSPMMTLAGYDSLFPEVPIGHYFSDGMTFHNELYKNFGATWIIKDGKLYLNRIWFIKGWEDQLPREVVTFSIDSVSVPISFKERYKRVEKLTGLKFHKTQYFDTKSLYKRMHWFSWPETPKNPGVIPAT